MIKKNLIISALLFSILIITGGYYVFYRNEVLPDHLCLKKNQQADFKIERLGKYPSVEYNMGSAEIIIKDNGNEILKFRIDNIVNPSHYHPLEIHKCNVYVMKGFNFDYTKSKALPGFSVELWKYQYNGSGERIFELAGEDDRGKAEIYYSNDFRIPTDEKYLVLEKGYLGKDDYALVIKDLNTTQDVFEFSTKSVAQQYPDRVGSFGMLEWTNDSRYFWGDIFDGAYDLAYFRIDVQNWKAEIFEAADGSMGGMPLNINTGYVPIQPGLVWTGDVESTQELKQKEMQEGKKSSLYLYSLFTKEKVLIETTDEPQFFFKPNWLSDTELQYILPSGETKIFTIPK